MIGIIGCNLITMRMSSIGKPNTGNHRQPPATTGNHRQPPATAQDIVWSLKSFGRVTPTCECTGLPETGRCPQKMQQNAADQDHLNHVEERMCRKHQETSTRDQISNVRHLATRLRSLVVSLVVSCRVCNVFVGTVAQWRRVAHVQRGFHHDLLRV